MTAPPEGGRANSAVRATLAEALGLSVSAVRVTAGATAREKTLHVTGDPETLLQNRYGRLCAATTAADGLVWVGTTNKGSGGKVVPSDDRVIRIQPPTGGGESRT